jgi:hypothetical protein
MIIRGKAIRRLQGQYETRTMVAMRLEKRAEKSAGRVLKKDVKRELRREAFRLYCRNRGRTPSECLIVIIARQW